jgi:hypothetical protein
LRNICFFCVEKKRGNENLKFSFVRLWGVPTYTSSYIDLRVVKKKFASDTLFLIAAKVN